MKEKKILSENEIKAKVEYLSSARCNHTPHKYIDITGDLVAGTLLAQIMYWFAEGKNRVSVYKDGFYWIAKRREDWMAEIRITKKQYDCAIKKLTGEIEPTEEEKKQKWNKGKRREKKYDMENRLVEVKTYHFYGIPTTHIRPITENINKKVDEWKRNVEEEIRKENNDACSPNLPNGNLVYLPNGNLEISEEGKSYNNIYNNINADTENTNRDYIHNSLSVERGESESRMGKPNNRKKESDELFERVWKLYPKKLGKGQVSDTQKLKLLKIGYDELERAVNRCCQYNKDRDMQYWQNGSTFFNSGYVDFLDDNFNGDNEINKKEQPEIVSEMEIEDNELSSGEEFQTIDQSELEDEIIFAAHSFSSKCSSLCLVNKIKDFMFCFIERYAQKTGKSHPMVYPDMLGRIMYIITNKIVINGITYKPLVTEDLNDEAYKEIIDKYFEKNKTNFTLEDFCDKNKIYEMMSSADWSVII